MEFLNIYAFSALIAVFAFVFIKTKKLPFSKEVAEKIVLKGKISKKQKFYILLTAYTLLVTALARPVINNGYITVKAPVENLVIALDISYEMDKKDLYPNRYQFAITKIKKLLTLLNSQNTALILFDKNSYLISPPTRDYSSLSYLLEHTDIKDLKRSPSSDIPNMISSAMSLVKNPKIVIFTSQPYIPKEKNIFVYNTSNTKINAPRVFNAEYSNENLEKLVKSLNSLKNKAMKIKDKKELFYLPLGAALILIMFALLFPIRRKR